MKRKPYFMLLLPLILTSCQITTTSHAESEGSVNSQNVQSVTSTTGDSQTVASVDSQTGQTSVNSQTGNDSTGTSDQGQVSALTGNHRTFYQLLVYSFADGNGDGIGDFKGIEDHLDYLSDMGIGGLWLSPINKCSSYHGYDVQDYYSINSEYEVTVAGVTYDFDHLLNACHKKNIKVLMDMVFNHTSTKHTWYQKHRKDWYSGDNAFSGDMADLDYENPDVRQAVKDVGKYWIRKGVDGFRLDAALWIYNKNGMGSADIAKDNAWWTEFGNAIRSENKDAYLVGEVLDSKYASTTLLNSGLDATFDFNQRYKILDAIRNDQGSGYAQYEADFQATSRGEKASTIEAHIVSNHDIGRFNVTYGLSTKQQLEFMNALNIFAPGDPYIYYGDELGLKGNNSGGYDDMKFRTPMAFGSGTTDVTYFHNFGNIRSTGSTTFSGKTAEEDAADTTSICSYVRKAVNFKNEHPSLYSGKATASYTSNGIEALRFENGTKDLMVLANTNKAAKDVTINGATMLETFDTSDSVSGLNGTKLTISGKSVVVLEVTDSFSITDVTGSATQTETYPTLPPVKDGYVRTHFRNSENWDTVDAYYWGTKQTVPDWPGYAATYEANGWWYYDVPSDITGLIFNNAGNGQQTVDITAIPTTETYYTLTGEASKGKWNVYGSTSR